MKKIRVIALAMVLCVLASACGNGETGTTDGNAGADADITSAQSESAEESFLENVSEIVIPEVSAEQTKHAEDATEIINQYLVARAYFDELLQYDIESGNIDEYSKLFDMTENAFDIVYESSIDCRDATMEEAAKELDALGNRTSTVYEAEGSCESETWADELLNMEKYAVCIDIVSVLDNIQYDSDVIDIYFGNAHTILNDPTIESFSEKANAACETVKEMYDENNDFHFQTDVVYMESDPMPGAVLSSGGLFLNGFNSFIQVGINKMVMFVGNGNHFAQSFENLKNTDDYLMNRTQACFGVNLNQNSGSGVPNRLQYLSSNITVYNEYASDKFILGGIFTQANDGISCTIGQAPTLAEVWGEESAKAEGLLGTFGYSEEEIKAVAGKGIETVPKIEFGGVLSKEAIDTIFACNSEAVAAVETYSEKIVASNDTDDSLGADEESATIEKEDDSVSEPATDKEPVSDKEPTTDKEPASAQNTGNGYPSAEELAGYYPFQTYMAYPDDLGMEGEYPQTIRCTSGNNLEMVNPVDGWVSTGIYDPSTGKVDFSEPNSSMIVSFTKENGKIHAKLSALFSGGLTMSGTATKQ